MAGKGSEGGAPAPVVPGSNASPGSGIQDAVQAQQRFDQFMQRMASGAQSPYYRGSPFQGYGGPKLPPLPPTQQYGGSANRPSRFTQPGVPNMPLQPSTLFGNLLLPPQQQPPSTKPTTPPVQPPPPLSSDAIEHFRTQPLPYNQAFIPQPYGMEAVGDYSIQRMNYQGRDVYRFEVRDGDVQTWDRNNIGPGGSPNERAEVRYTEGASSQKGTSPYNPTPTTGRTLYGMNVMFDSQYPLDQRWATLLQFHPADGGAWGFGGLTVHGDRLTARTPDGSRFVNEPIQRNHWYDIKLDVNWSSGSSGYVKVYDGTRLLGTYNGPTINSPYSYIKQGYYRDGSTSSTGVVYQTPLRITMPR